MPAAWAVVEPVSSSATDTYGVDAQTLEALFARLPIEGFQTPPALSSAHAWLPTRNGAFVPPADTTGSPATRSRAAFRRRTVCVASLAWPQAVALLSESLERETFGDGIRIGRDVSALARVLRFALELVAGKHVLPGVIAGADDHRRSAGKTRVHGACTLTR
jgi:hypothetical protein